MLAISNTAPLAFAPVIVLRGYPALRRYVSIVPENVRTEAWGMAAQREGIHTEVLK